MGGKPQKFPLSRDPTPWATMVRSVPSRKWSSSRCRTWLLQTTAAYRLGAVDVAGQADDEVVGDGVHQVPEAGVAIQHIIQRG